MEYLPNIVSNTTANAVILTIIPGILYTAAAYAHLYLKQPTYMMSLIISVFFATLEYAARIPVIQYSASKAGMSNGAMQIVWVIITLILAAITDKLYPLPKHTP